jgi:hypothetical protein
MALAEEFLFSEPLQCEGKHYLVHIYRQVARPERCCHMATTVLGPGDTIISDGRSPEEALRRLQTILPLAIFSRSLL